MSINKIFVSGFVGADPEPFESKDKSKQYAGFDLAESRTDNDGNEVTYWHQVSAGGKLAETLLKHVKKGDKLVIEGVVTPAAYINKENKVIPQLKIWLTAFDFASNKEKLNDNKKMETTNEFSENQPNN